MPEASEPEPLPARTVNYAGNCKCIRARPQFHNSVGMEGSTDASRPWACIVSFAKDKTMLHYAVVFFVIALIAAVLGFRGVAGLSAEIGWLFAVLAVIALAVALLSGRGVVVIP